MTSDSDLCFRRRRFRTCRRRFRAALRDIREALWHLREALRDIKEALFDIKGPLLGLKTALFRLKTRLRRFVKQRSRHKTLLCRFLSRSREFKAADLFILRRACSVDRFDVLFDERGERHKAVRFAVKGLVAGNAGVAERRNCRVDAGV